MTDTEIRETLVAVAERDEHDLQTALGDLRRAVERPFAVGAEVGENIGAHPLIWVGGALLLGVWLGSRP